MSRDRDLLERVAASPEELYVCVYTWQPACVSLGAFQNVDEAFLFRARELGLDVVRRPTGGRAVLHHLDYSYSIVASTAWGIPEGVRASYAYLNGVLEKLLELLGFKPDRTHDHRSVRGKTSCFSFTQLSDLAYQGKKICGSAQRWKDHAVLQHGSFQTELDYEMLTRLFGQEEADEIVSNTATLTGVSFEDFAAAMREAVEEKILLNSKLRFNI